MFSRRLFLLKLLIFLTACSQRETAKLGRLTIGAVSYGESDRSMARYSPLLDYLEAELKTIIEFEPTFNEVRALDQIRRGNWSLVFAPPGLAAIAIFEEQYSPLFPLAGVDEWRAILLVRQDSSIQTIQDFAGKAIALGQSGSATGYYLPIYELYGLTLAEVRFAPTPQTMLQWIETGEVTAGALSLAELRRYHPNVSQSEFRVIDLGSAPPGAILAGPTIELNQQEQIRQALKSASPNIIDAAGYLPNSPVPDYRDLIQVVNRVRGIAERIREKPAPLYEPSPT